MDAEEAIRRRRSVRSYQKKPVPNKILRRVLEAGRISPSARNIQPWSFIVVRDPTVRRAISRTGRFSRFLAETPVVIVGCGDRAVSPKWYAVDVSIALENMVVVATAEGLGTCWIGSFNPAKVKEMLKIPDGLEVVALLAVGYPKKQDQPSSRVRRKRLGEVAMLEEYGRPYR